MLGAVAGLAISIACGALALRIVWPELTWSKTPALATALSFGFGSAISSMLFFIAFLFFDASILSVLALDVGALCILLFSTLRQKALATGDALTYAESSPLSRPMAFVFSMLICIALVNAAINFSSHAWRFPDGGYDALRVWNLRARCLAGGANWRATFDSASDFPHLDYPLFLPTIVAREFKYGLGYYKQISMAIGVLFTAAALTLLYAVLRVFTTRIQATLGLVLLASTPYFIGLGTQQLADVPLSYFMLALIFIIELRLQGRAQPRVLFLAGLAASSAAWTKNEGIPFAVIVTFVYGIRILFDGGYLRLLKDYVWLLAGAVWLASIHIYFKWMMAPVNELVIAGQAHSMRSRLLDPDRFGLICQTLKRHLSDFGDWNSGCLLFLIGYLLIVGITRNRQRRAGALFSVIILTAMLCTIVLAFQITPYDLEWHMETSMKRLLLQLWPTAIAGYFQLARAVDDKLDV